MDSFSQFGEMNILSLSSEFSHYFLRKRLLRILHFAFDASLNRIHSKYV